MKHNYPNYWKIGMSMFIGLCISGAVSAQSIQQKEKIVSNYDQNQLKSLEVTFKQKATQEKEKAIKMAQEKGWDIIKTESDGRLMELQKVTADGYPIYYTTYNVDAAKSTRTDHLNSGGSLGLNLNGQNMIAHVWDGGIARASHQEYDGAGGTNRFSVGDGSTSLNFHAAHVTGTIIASGVQPQAKGMAPHSRAIGYDWNNDISEATNAASNGMLISNHSYGYRSDLVPDWYFGAYIEESRNWDNLMRNSPYYLMVVAAGNDGSTNYNGSPLGGQSSYDKLTGHSVSKNNMVVANANDANVASNGDLISVLINSSSSQGPTDDLRIKPDITGNGTGVYSTYHNSNTAYNSITGTSMASPNVAGSLLLLQQHHDNLTGNFMRAATLKGLVLHTADDAGPTGPDAVYGWGLMNTKRAAEVLSANGTSSIVEERSLSSGQSYSFQVQASGVEALQASISWTDLPGVANTGTTNDPTKRLVNDLDIRVTQSGTTYFPWKLTGVTTNSKADNNADPYERVDVDNASGTYTITVTHKGSLSGGAQPYSIIVTGINAEPVACNATVPTGVNVSNIGSNSATVGWSAVAGATYDVRYRVSGTSTWTVTSVGQASLALSGLSSSTSYDVQVRSKCESSTSAYSSTVNFTTTELVIEYCASNGNNTSDEYISRVQLGSINNTSGASSGGYQNFTNISTDLAHGENYTITVTPTWTGSTYSEGYSVWIDYNNDGTFSTNEQVWTQSATTASPVSGSFTVPNDAVLGNTRMRVSMKYNGIPSACESFSWGEVEDYTVNITEAAALPCDAPTSLTATSITASSATLSWAAQANANEYNVRLRPVGTSTWSTGSTSGTSLNSTGLSEGTQYEFQVRSVCASGVSNYSASTTFTTLVTCNAPTGLSSSNITENSATISWSSAGNAGSYGVRYRVSGTSTWSTGTVSGTSANLSGLAANTTYEFQVRSVCGSQNSAYSASSSLTTLQAQISYCSSQGNNSSYEWIRRIRLNEIDNESGNNGGYADFTSQVATVQRGASVTMNVQAGFSGSSYNEYWSIWVDLNQDGVFSSDERLINGSSSSSNLLSATLSIPSTALLGQTRMRVTMKYNAAATPCETFTYGEVEDYTVNIVNSLSGNAVMADNGIANPLGNEENPADSRLYPNPARSVINFMVNDLDKSEAVRIYSSSGALIREITPTDNQMQISVSDLSQGMYMIKAKTLRKDYVVEKFVIN